MKPYLYINLLLILLGSVLTYHQVFSPEVQHFSQLMRTYQSETEAENRPVKTLMVDTADFACWLSQTGELHSFSDDSSGHVLLNRRGGAWADVTFIEDFCLSPSGDSIYFTDIMDLKSGHGAIKCSDRQGYELQTLAILPDEIPYQLSLSPSGDILFYLSQQNYRDASYQLRFIDLKNGTKGTLHSSSRKISQLNIDKSLKLLSIADPAEGQLRFATHIDGSGILAELVPNQEVKGSISP
jgi:hypothetical protein